MSLWKILAFLSITFACIGTAASANDPVLASWYGAKYRGKPTASGERYDPAQMTAAHPTLAFGTMVEVRRWTDGRAVVVRINDRGPHDGRGIDLSEAAARRLGLVADGSALVTVHPVARMAAR